MHKVWNVGSALQAYATQKSIEDLGYSSELIDYEYPNLEHRAAQGIITETKSINLIGALRLVAQKIKAKLSGKKENLFQKFYEDYFKCTTKSYHTRKSLMETPPLYDIYVTGSDQVWNPRYIGFDTNFFLDFAPVGCKKISYASSFSSNNITEHFRKLYSEKLSQYDNISVRESSACNIVKEMTGKDADVVCDPTILLNAEQWETIAENSKVKPTCDYLLVYILGYAYNPYPDIYKYIERLEEKYNLPIIYLNTIRGRLKGKYNEIKINNWGPVEFLYLIKNAKHVITDSFHGTAFSLNFGTPFTSCIKSKEASDSRMLDLLRTVKAEDRAVVYNLNDEINYAPISTETKTHLETFRAVSFGYIKRAIEE